MNLSLQKNILLRDLTTYRIGGRAKYFLLAETANEVRDAVKWCKDEGLQWFLIGAGSNVLVDDEGFQGLVMKLGKKFSGVRVDHGNNIVTAGGAVRLPELGMRLAELGWEGFGYMCGIPGTVGGAVRMNAGTVDGEIKENFISAKVITASGESVMLDNTAMRFTYRDSMLVKERGIVLEAVFRLERKADPGVLKAKTEVIISVRRSKQPIEPRNCGSVFKTPSTGKPAGWYLEQAGMKGMKIGGAMVAQEHANWIVNTGGATSRDIKELINIGQARVLEKFGVKLEREVIYFPEDIQRA